MTSPPNEPRPTPLSPRTLLTGELPAVLSLWDHPTPALARQLLALWAGLRRLAPGAADPDEEQLVDLVQKDGDRLTQFACAEPPFDADDWKRRADDLDRAWDEGTESTEELRWQTHELFEELDRAALAAWALEHVTEYGGSAVPDWLATAWEAIDQAEAFLAAQTDLFLCLATEVAAVLSATRPGLLETDSRLAATLLKHRRIEEARDELETPPDPAILLASACKVTTPRHTARLPEPNGGWLPEPPLLLAADAPRPAGLVHLHWREPGGTHTATLVVNRADATTPLRINFYRGDEPATDLAGAPVRLAGVAGTIDPAGNADFDQERLRQAQTGGRPATLQVGPARLAWEPATDSPS